MNQNPFGAPAPGAEPAPLPDQSLTAEKSHKGLLLGGLGGLTALVVAGGAFLMFSGGDDVEPAPVAGAPVPAATSTTTEPPAPLPTLAEFNGRNPFKAKIVEAGAAGGGAAAPADGSAPAAPAGSSAQPTTAPGAGGTARPGGGGGNVVFVPGPTVTKTVPGPVQTETVTVPGPTETVYLEPGNIQLTFLGTDVADDATDDPTLPDFQVNDWLLLDVGDDVTTENDEDVFAYYFKLLAVEVDGSRARLQFGDDLVWADKDVTRNF